MLAFIDNHGNFMHARLKQNTRSDFTSSAKISIELEISFANQEVAAL